MTIILLLCLAPGTTCSVQSSGPCAPVPVWAAEPQEDEECGPEDYKL